MDIAEQHPVSPQQERDNVNMANKEISQIEEILKQEQIISSSLTNGDGPWTIICDDWNDDNEAYSEGVFEDVE